MSSYGKRADSKYKDEQKGGQTKNEKSGAVNTNYPNETYNRLHQEHFNHLETSSLQGKNRSVLWPPRLPSRVRSAPSSPLLSRQRPQVCKTSSLTSFNPLNTGLNARENYTGNSVESSTPPLSPALRRKLQNTDQIVKEARMHIDDYRRQHPGSASTANSTIDVKSLEEALKEVQNCRYLRVVVDRNDGS